MRAGPKVALVGASLLVVVAVYAFVVSPLATIHQIKAGIQQQDAEKLSDAIDFPTLRENLKEQFDAVIAKKAGEKMRNNPLGALGMVFASKIAETMVDSIITPSGLAAAVAGKEPGAAPDQASPDTNDSSPRQNLFKNARYTYDSLSKFSVRVPTKNNAEVRLVLIRNGLSWKLSNIVLPMAE
jgi:hypothetical protein